MIQQPWSLVLLKRVEYLGSPTCLYTVIYENFIYNHQNLEAIKMSFIRGLNKEAMVLLENGILFSSKEK